MTLFNCSDSLCKEIVDNSSTHNHSTKTFLSVSKTNTDSEYVYVILTAVTSGLSITGGATICILYVSFRDIRTPSRALLFFLAFSDAFLAFGNLLGVLWYLYSDSKTIHRSHGYCAFQSAMTIYFSCTSFFWTVIMALNLFHAVVLKNATFAANYMKLFHLLAWLPPGIIVTVALAMDVLGTDTTLEQASWCWIDPRTPNVLVWQFATGKFWEILAYIAVVILYLVIKVFLKKQELKKKALVGPGSINRTRKDVLSEANRKLTFVPFVFIVCRIWGTLRFLLGNFAVDHINEPYVTWINPLQGIGDSAQGFANCVLYCLSTEKIRQRLARTICPRRIIPLNTSDSRTESNSKYKKRTCIGIEENISQSYADIGPSQVDKEQSVTTAVTNIDHATLNQTSNNAEERISTAEDLKTTRHDIGPIPVVKEQSVTTAVTNIDHATLNQTSNNAEERISTDVVLKTSRHDIDGSESTSAKCNLSRRVSEEINDVAFICHEMTKITRSNGNFYSERDFSIKKQNEGNSKNEQAEKNEDANNLQDEQGQTLPIKKRKAKEISTNSNNNCNNTHSDDNQIGQEINASTTHTGSHTSQGRYDTNEFQRRSVSSEENERTTSRYSSPHSKTKDDSVSNQTVRSDQLKGLYTGNRSEAKLAKDMFCVTNGKEGYVEKGKSKTNETNIENNGETFEGTSSLYENRSDLQYAKSELKDNPASLTTSFHKIEELFCVAKSMGSDKT